MSKNRRTYTSRHNAPHAKRAGIFALTTIGLIAFSCAAGSYSFGRRPAIIESKVESRESGAELWIPACAGMTKTTQNSRLKTQDSRLIVTAYCPCEKCCGRWANVYPRRTASGHKIRPGDKFCAADKSVPFGTMITIPGYNDGQPVPVLDRGGAITGDHIDVYFDSHKEALRWGIKNLELRIEN